MFGFPNQAPSSYSLNTLYYVAYSRFGPIIVQCSLQFCVKLVDTAGRKIQIRKIGIINLVVILILFLPLFVQKYM